MISSFGFSFKNKHSYNDFKLIMHSVDRSLLPAVKRQQIDITFLDGKIDLQKEPIYDNRIITVSLVYHFNTPYDMQVKKRQVAQWLTGRSRLIFDDEPDKYYDAKVFDAVAIVQDIGRMEIQISLECTPFAMHDLKQMIRIITTQNQRETVNIIGNVKTCGTITLTNIGTTTINSLKLRRERERD